MAATSEPRSTVVGAFEDRHQADTVISELRQAGFREDQIAIQEDRSVGGSESDRTTVTVTAEGRYDEATHVYEQMVDATAHANGAYTAEEKNNRGIFLDRLASVYHEQNKTGQAIAAYQKMIELGGDQALLVPGEPVQVVLADRHDRLGELYRQVAPRQLDADHGGGEERRRRKPLLARRGGGCRGLAGADEADLVIPGVMGKRGDGDVAVAKQ